MISVKQNLLSVLADVLEAIEPGAGSKHVYAPLR